MRPRSLLSMHTAALYRLYIGIAERDRLDAADEAAQLVVLDQLPQVAVRRRHEAHAPLLARPRSLDLVRPSGYSYGLRSRGRYSSYGRSARPSLSKWIRKRHKIVVTHRRFWRLLVIHHVECSVECSIECSIERSIERSMTTSNVPAAPARH